MFAQSRGVTQEFAGKRVFEAERRVQIEKLLAEIEAMEAHESSDKTAGSGGWGSLDARVRMFERLASEVARLNFYAVRGKVGLT